MKNFKSILMAGLLLTSLLLASTSFAAGDPNSDAPVNGAEVVAPGTGCTACAANSVGGTLLDNPATKDQHNDLLNNSGTAADKAGVTDKGSN